MNKTLFWNKGFANAFPPAGLLARYTGGIANGKLLASTLYPNTTQQVKGSGFFGAGSATVTGLLTTDTITATGTAPTCSVNGTLTFGTSANCWDVYVHRAGVLWAFWPGVNVGQTTELDASGLGHHLTALTTTTITERLDGSGSNYANERGFSDRENYLKNSTNPALWTKVNATTAPEGEFWRVSFNAASATLTTTTSNVGFTAYAYGRGNYEFLALSPTERTRMITATDSFGDTWMFLCRAKDDGLAQTNSMKVVLTEKTTGNWDVVLQGSSGSWLLKEPQMIKQDPSKTPNPGVVVCVGDSLTTLYPTHLQRLLPNATIINSGVGGNKIEDIIARFSTDVAAHNPDVILLMMGTNNVKNTSVTTIETLYSEVLALCDATGATVIVGNLIPRAADLAGWSDAHQTVLTSVNGWLESLDRIVIDMYSKFQQPGTNDLMHNYTVDGVHPHAVQAQNYLAEEFAFVLGWEYPEYVATTTAVVLGVQPAVTASLDATGNNIQYPGPLGIDATVVSGTTLADAVIQAPLGPRFQAIPGFTNNASVTLNTLTPTDQVYIGEKALLIYENGLSGSNAARATRYVGPAI